jgi:tetratricopeptide (TPR) repeat protein
MPLPVQLFHRQPQTPVSPRAIALSAAAAFFCCTPLPVLPQDTRPVTANQRTASDYLAAGIKWNFLGRHDEAIADLSKAIELDPANPGAFIARANSRAKTGKTDVALADCNEAIRLAPSFAAAYHNRGLIWSDVGQRDKAVEDFTEAIRLDPQLAFAYHNRGNVRRELGEYDKAIADFNEAIRLEPQYSLAYYNRGIVWYHKREYEKAVSDYERALEIGLGEPFVHNAIAWTRATCPDLSIRDGKAALKHAKIACKLTSFKDYAFVDTLAAAYAQANDFENAVSTIDLALKLAPGDRREDLEARRARYKVGQTYGTDHP